MKGINIVQYDRGSLVWLVTSSTYHFPCIFSVVHRRNWTQVLRTSLICYERLYGWLTFVQHSLFYPHRVLLSSYVQLLKKFAETERQTCQVYIFPSDHLLGLESSCHHQQQYFISVLCKDRTFSAFSTGCVCSLDISIVRCVYCVSRERSGAVTLVLSVTVIRKQPLVLDGWITGDQNVFIPHAVHRNPKRLSEQHQLGWHQLSQSWKQTHLLITRFWDQIKSELLLCVSGFLVQSCWDPIG